MKYLKKVSLSKGQGVPDDVKVALINDEVKTELLRKKIDYENAAARNRKILKPESLLQRLWPAIEHYTKSQRQEAIKMIKKLDATPTVQINDNLEIVYNGDVIRGTNIVQLIRSEVNTQDGGRVLLPGQDLFNHVLLTAPYSSSSDSRSDTPYKKKRKKRKHSPLTGVKNRKKLKKNLLHKSARKSLDYSPIRLRSTSSRPTTSKYGSKTPPSLKESRWKR